ncbi:MAG: protein-methionine-sulfoxide reductase catalytic subunit MsrP [Beijerinckiaceae bacterium]
MLILRKRGWEIPETFATPEPVVMNRRAILAAGGFFAAGISAAQAQSAPARNPRYTLDRPLTDEKLSSNHNNYYEFGSSKRTAAAAQALNTDGWKIRIEGLVEKPFEISADELIAAMPIEERLYRFRCVEAWSMAVPWTGFPMKALLDRAKPLSSAKYIEFRTFQNPAVAPGQKQSWYPWPYVEGVTMAEAANELTFMATGIYGKTLPKQFGAPVRLVLPWKYGFKSIKAIDRIVFRDTRPKSFWETLQPQEYGFWANVNPDVPHPRWSQASETLLGSLTRTPTLLFNGYTEFVADLYKGLEKEQLYL